MKLNLNNFKVVAMYVFPQTKSIFADANVFLRENKVSKKLTVLTLITALLTPVFLFSSFVNKTNAQEIKLSSSISQPPIPLAEPPAPFIYSSSDTVSAKFVATILTVNTTLTNGFVSTADLFKTPQLPEGFETAEPVSPAEASLLSIGDSIRSFFGISSPTSNAVIAPSPVPAGSTSFDFDGDGKADVARFRTSSGAWEIKYGNNTTASGTLAAGKLAPADYDGDGKTDLASFNNGTWNIRQSSNGQTVQITGFGQSGDIPVSGNYAGSPAIDLALYRPSNGTWYVREAAGGTVTSTQFGAAGDIAAPGNYDGDGAMDFAVFRPSNGYWYISGSTSGFYTYAWGVATDIPVPADYDGDGKTDCAVYRASAGAWYAAKSSAPGQYVTDTWGNYGDQPTPADYDNDGKADFSVYRPTSGVWHTKKSNGGSYEFTALGTPQDTAVSSAYIKQVGGQVVTYDMVKTRLSPKNYTGGTNLYSRNFGWSSSLVGLSGRAGLDMGFGISYNSLVWTKHTDPATNTSTMYFDVDNSNVSPGFRFGFPTIEPIYYDSQTGKFSYLMVSPSGARTEFKQIGASDVYETVDSSYVQLRTKGADSANDPVENISITVIGTDGTKMNYSWKGGAFRASEIKDRNGNFITINHDNYGLLQSVTDTLGRVVTVDYDSQLYPTAIKQIWKDNNGQGSSITHYWARFEYTNINVNPSFDSSLGVYGPSGGASVKVLNKIKSADDSYTVFEYQSNGFGQVSKIRNFAPDNHELNYVQTNLASPGTNLTDCPRLSQIKSWVENFNNGQEVTINNSLLSNQSYSLPDGHSGTAAKIEMTMANHPHGAVSKTFVGESGWMEALPIATEDWANGTSNLERKRWTWTGWTQDDPNLAYILNPRSTESKVGDTANIKRSTTEYKLIPNTTVAEYGLVSAVKVYDTDQTTVLKKAETDYNLSPAYVSRRIIGLPSETRSYGFENSALSLASKATFAYDEENFAQETNQNISSVIQHDNTNFSSSFIAGRGNLTSTTRHDVLGLTSSVTSKARYDIAGSTVAQLDPLNHKVRIEYADSFNDTTASSNTFAYPTKVYDPAGKFSIVKYRFDTGANVWAKSPDLSGNINGLSKETARLFDAIGRLEKETLVNTGAYTRYEYPTNSIQSKVYSTVIDTNGNGADASDEVYSESWFDGAGRTLRSRSEHPNSTGGWTATIAEYDILGRAKRSTVPTEIAVSGNNWTPAGDDNRGFEANGNPVWLWQSQEYDWKGRVTREINTDGTDRLYSYEGCGCAGGQVTTVQGELVPRDDQPNINARRTQRIYQDILGRTKTTEVLNWDGITPYTTTTQTFNSRDQIAETKQYSGGTNSSTFQKVTMTYDGHGRMKTRHYPVEDALTDTTWIYNADDSVQQIIDPRGAITNFTYNDPRGLLTKINYQVPSNSTVPISPQVDFTYDNLGNRLSMDTAGISLKTYTYDNLSRVTSETVDFDDLTENYTIGYTYHLNGSLKSVTDPLNSTVNYANDKTGKLIAVTGTSWGNNTTGDYVNDIKYRAFGSIKKIAYKLPDEISEIKMNYDDRLRINHSEVTTGKTTSGYLLKADFTYFADSRLSGKNDLLNDKWDRTNKYDHAGRIVFNQFGMGEASDFPGSYKRVYEQSITYDAFSMMTSRSGEHWGRDIDFSESYTNGRMSNNPNVLYDASGNIIDSNINNSNPHDFERAVFDAAGRRIISHNSVKGQRGNRLNMVTETKGGTDFDGDGNPVIGKTGTYTYHATTGTPPTTGWQPTANEYNIWSSVLGATVMTLNKSSSGDYEKINVFAGKSVIAQKTHSISNGQSVEGIEWKTTDPVTGTGAGLTNGSVSNTEEYEPLGQSLDNTDTAEPPSPTPSQIFLGSADEPEWRCQVPIDFQPWHCQMRAEIANSLNGTGIYTTYDPKKNPGDPKFIHAGDTPREQSTQSASDRAMNESLHATDKPKDIDYGGEAIQSASVPNASGAPVVTNANGTNSNGSNDDDTVYGPANGESRVTVRDLSIPDFIGADVSNTVDGEKGYYTPTSKELEDRFKVTLADKNCKDFLVKVRDSLDIDKTFPELLKDALKKGPKGKKGILYDPQQRTQELSSVGKHNQIGLLAIPIPDIPDPKTLEGLLSLQLNAYVASVIHALIHRAGDSSHSKFAEAADGALSAAERKADPLPVKGKKESEDAFDRRNSLHFQKILKLKCPGVVP